MEDLLYARNTGYRVEAQRLFLSPIVRVDPGLWTREFLSVLRFHTDRFFEDISGAVQSTVSCRRVAEDARLWL